MEKWNAYTRDGKLTDTVLFRGEVIPEGLYHLVCEVLVQHADGSYLCMKRAISKPSYPGYYEATAGGSALLGEDSDQCIKRELKEETGIDCKEFQKIGSHIDEEGHCIYCCYVCTVACDKNSIQLQEGETEDYKWMTEEEFKAFINSDKAIKSQKLRFLNYFKEKEYIL